MYNFCTKCGKEDRSETGVCRQCSTRTQPQIEPEKKPLPFAEPPARENRFDLPGYPTRPVGDRPVSPPQPGKTAGVPQTASQCPYCGGSGGIFAKSEISTAGFVYLAVMITLTLLFLVIFFPCALIPFALIFLVFLFKDKYFACVNCHHRIQ